MIRIVLDYDEAECVRRVNKVTQQNKSRHCWITVDIHRNIEEKTHAHLFNGKNLQTIELFEKSIATAAIHKTRTVLRTHTHIHTHTLTHFETFTFPHTTFR